MDGPMSSRSRRPPRRSRARRETASPAAALEAEREHRLLAGEGGADATAHRARAAAHRAAGAMAEHHLGALRDLRLDDDRAAGLVEAEDRARHAAAVMRGHAGWQRQPKEAGAHVVGAEARARRLGVDDLVPDVERGAAVELEDGRLVGAGDAHRDAHRLGADAKCRRRPRRRGWPRRGARPWRRRRRRIARW